MHRGQSFSATLNDASVRDIAGMGTAEKYVSVKKYKGHALERDTVYSVVYHRSQLGDAPATASIHIQPYTPRDDERCTSRQMTRLRLDLVRLPAGTAISDAVTLLALKVPAQYRDLWHSVQLDERHFMEWEGERKA